MGSICATWFKRPSFRFLSFIGYESIFFLEMGHIQKQMIKYKKLEVAVKACSVKPGLYLILSLLIAP